MSKQAQLDMQVGGDHYIRCAIQPWEIIERNELDFWEGNVVKYVLRHRMKGGIEDLLKAKHYLEYLISKEERKANVQNQPQQERPEAPAFSFRNV